jgi:recombination protein RecA
MKKDSKDTIKLERKSIDSMMSKGGGIPLGRMTELYGKDGCGKPTFAIILLTMCQKLGLKAAYMDIESGLDIEYAEFLGFKPKVGESLFYPETGEEALQETERLIEEGYTVIIIDSVAGLVTEAQLETDLGDTGQYAQVASLLARTLPRLSRTVRIHKAHILFINQLRAKIKKFAIGRDYDSFGGYALKYFASARIEMVKMGDLKYSDTVVGFKSKLTAWKNKKGIPKRPGYLNVTFDSEAPDVGLRETLIENGEIEKVTVKEDGKSKKKYRYQGKLYSIATKEIYDAIKRKRKGKGRKRT